MSRVLRPLAGLAAIIAGLLLAATAVAMFQGRTTDTVPLTVMSNRAGLVMNVDAKVKLLGVPVGGRVANIDSHTDGSAVIHLEMDLAELERIPANVRVDIASTTIFGAKSVELLPPDNPSPQHLKPGQVLDADHVTIEIDSIFEQLTAVLSKIQPEKLNATLGAMSTALDGRGGALGQALSDFESFLASIDPSMTILTRDIEAATMAVGTYADVAPDVLKIVDNATAISSTVVEEQHNLDAMLINATGLADIGNEVVGGNQHLLTDVVHLLLPTTALTSQYSPRADVWAEGVGAPGFSTTRPPCAGCCGQYRPDARLGALSVSGQPPEGRSARWSAVHRSADMPMNTRPPFVVTDTGANSTQYGNQGILLNSDGLKQLLFGPIDGPPRNSAQIGHPG